MINLNTTLLTIRERSTTELYDLSLPVLRQLFKPLLIAALVGMVPCALFNYWWLRFLPLENRQDYSWYTLLVMLLGWWQLPVATAPITVILGQAMFMRRIDYRRAALDLWHALPQLSWVMVLRTLVMPHGSVLIYPALASQYIFLWWVLGILWILPAMRWTYLNEVILLERNPWRRKAGQLNTGQRSRALHGGDSSLVLGRSITAAFWEQKLLSVFGLTIWYMWGNLQGIITVSSALPVIIFPVAFWLANWYLAVVRFLCYLDLRIRREGWEVDLALRAEAEHLIRALNLGAPTATTTNQLIPSIPTPLKI